MQELYIILMLLCILLLLIQLGVRHKQNIHLVFSLLCGSLAMFAAQRLAQDNHGFWYLVFGLGACLTCNGMWLVARVLFRPDQALGFVHWFAAGFVALLVVLSQFIQWLQYHYPDVGLILPVYTVVSQLLSLLSSTLIMLTCWEGLRGISTSRGIERKQRILFSCSFIFALVFGVIIGNSNLTVWLGIPSLVTHAVAAIQMLVVLQVLIYQRFPGQPAVSGMDIDTAASHGTSFAKAHSDPVSENVKLKQETEDESEKAWVTLIEQALRDQQLYLKPNLKVADLARLLNLPEYRVSKLMRCQFGAKNFNQYINVLRIEHACRILENPDYAHWSLLVVGLESGFASVGPFSRTFKASVGLTPHEYRLQKLNINAYRLNQA
jgi:AraC-like DNA-binding protein